MRCLVSAALAAVLFAATTAEAEAHGRFGYVGDWPGYHGFSAYSFYPPVYGPSVYYGGWGPGWGGWGYPGRLGGFGYEYSYYTHAPGFSFTYYRGPVPTYYPGPFGPYGYGYYGYGPYGW